jgi:hypothetical protein
VNQALVLPARVMREWPKIFHKINSRLHHAKIYVWSWNVGKVVIMKARGWIMRAIYSTQKSTILRVQSCKSDWKKGTYVSSCGTPSCSSPRASQQLQHGGVSSCSSPRASEQLWSIAAIVHRDALNDTSRDGWRPIELQKVPASMAVLSPIQPTHSSIVT